MAVVIVASYVRNLGLPYALSWWAYTFPLGALAVSSGVAWTVTGFESEEGKARIALFLDARSWPDGEEHLFAADLLTIRDGQAVATFENVPAGPFAVAVFHDKNENSELDADFLGIPSEDYGFSAGARDMFGPPSFEEARLDLAAGETRQITVEVK